MSGADDRFLSRERPNAGLSWLLVALIVFAAAASAVQGDLLWTAFALTVAVLAVLPPVLLRQPFVMVPWQVTLLTALPVLGRAFATVPVTGQLATYFSVAAIALVLAVELQLFTPVRMTDGFAVAFVVVGTLAAAGLWAVVRWSADLLLGTRFLFDPTVPEAVVERQLMVEFVSSTAAGVVAGLVFAFYVRRRVTPMNRSVAGSRQ